MPSVHNSASAVDIADVFALKSLFSFKTRNSSLKVFHCCRFTVSSAAIRRSNSVSSSVFWKPSTSAATAKTTLAHGRQAKRPRSDEKPALARAPWRVVQASLSRPAARPA
jgi:hypothetical protein